MMKTRTKRNGSWWLPLRGGEVGASLPEVMIAAAIILGGAAAANQVGASAQQTITQMRAKMHVANADSAVMMGGLKALQAARDSGNSCLDNAGISLGSYFLSSPNQKIGDRWVKFEGLSAGQPYVPMSSSPLPSNWTTALATCENPTDPANRFSCLRFTVSRDATHSAASLESKGFIAMSAVPWDANTNQEISTCVNADMDASGKGIRMNQVVFAESKGMGETPLRKVNLQQPMLVENGEETTAPQPPQGDWKQGENLLYGWRSLFGVPPKPGPDYVAWPVPYKRIYHAGAWWAVHVDCATSVCPQAAPLGWGCSWTLFRGSKCDKHPWFK